MCAQGGSVEAIAEAKAGIMKAKRPVVIARQPYPEALQVLERHAEQLDCPVIRPHHLIQLTAKQTLQENGTMLQMVSVNPCGLPWLQPTGAFECSCHTCFVFVSSYVSCPGDQLGANRQSSVHADPCSQNTAPMGKTAPNETTRCIWSTPSNKV